MATFTALNIEPDDQSDDEIDNTKEIQIEEALKLYQAALKLHSQGPKLYSQAKEAYAVLFKSEVFRYPESVTDFTRAEEHPEIEYTDASFALGLDSITAGEGVPSTLPQILYLSYKNHGQFIMDCVKFGLKHSERNSAGAVEIKQLEPQSNNALVDFSRALAADESDTELWRRAARLGALMGSRRIARYCLEAAVEVDDDPTVAEVDPASLEEGFAGEQLKEQLEVLSDQISLTHPIMGPFIKRPMPPYLTKYMDPYSFLPNPITSLERPQLSNEGAEVTTAYTIIQPTDGTWERLGTALFQQVSLSPGGLPGVRVLIDLPGMGSNNSHSQSILRTTSFPDSTRREWEGHAMPDEGTANDDIEPTPEDQIMKEVASASSYTPPPGSNEVANPLSGPPNDITKPQEPILPQSSITQDSEPIVLPTRKRSQSVAGLRETPEDDSGAQKRSKRIRNRADPAGETAVDPATQFAEQLKAFEQADAEAFRFVGSNLSKLGVDDLGTFEELHAAFSLQGDSDLTEKVANTAVRDLRDILRTWDDGKASTFLNSSPADMLGSLNGPVNSGIAAFLEHSNAGPLKVSNLPPFVLAEGLFSFMRRVENDWMTLQDVIFEWVCVILRTYRRMQWQDDLKIIFVQLICYTDADIFGRLHADMASFHESTIHSQERIMECEDLVQSLFELHLDVYSRITNPGSIVHHDTRVMTKERLDRWADFAADVVRSRPRKSYDELSLRYLWASVFYATTAEYVSREHKVLCWSELKTLLQECERPAIELQNNAVMPEISIAAAEREVNRLTTMDFFFNLFRTDNTDPVAIIETLEPVLDPESAIQQASPESGYSGDSSAMELSAGTESVSASLREMWKFLKAGSISLRLFLWQRLREAYVSIDYSTKVFSCHLKSLEIIVAHFRSEEYVESPEEPRRHKMLTWLKALDDLLVRALSIALNDSERCFEIIDERHIKSTCAALAQLSRILHAAAMFDDQVRVGMIQLPNRPAFGERGNFTSLTTKLREMQVRTWALQYAMVKEGMNQSPENFPTSDMDLADYLAVVHYGLGLRKCCRASNKIFLKMMKVEMLRMTHVDRWEDYLGQVLFDLYGVRLGVGTWDLDDHGCTTETLDRRTALNIAEQVIMLANRMPIKDLLKDELRPTIEKMQAALGPSKTTPQMQHNLRNYTEYLKTSIRPLHMYQALKGQVQVDSLPVVKQDTSLADKRWYFLLGMMNLTKFRSQKRLAPGTQQDDLRIAASFLRIQLQHTADDWETWYRLAQCFDLELEEEVLWTADKINNSRRQLIILQRSSIHCYIMALSTAVRNAPCTLETAEKLSEMYHDFGMRIYASSREPFDNEAFWVEDFEKHMSGHQGMYKRALHDEMSKYKVWKYASNLFKKALIEKPRNWMSHYMLGKCQWKMYCKAPDDDRDRASRPSMWSPLNSFLKAIETVPKQRDSRAEPVLEPHYKLISSVHKLVVLGDMDMQEGANLLQQQPFAINKGGEVLIKDQEEWNDFMLRAFRQVRQADKSHWHHRMVARVVRILYDPVQPNAKRAAQARHELQTSILTKTMHVQVWKPEAERPGRHHVYMERYVRLIIKILYNLEDKAGMEALAKRVRKRAGDYFRYHIVWQECCTAYLRLIRRVSKIPANMDEVFKGVPHEEFEILSDRLNNWIADPHQSHPALDALRETIELKKLNQNLMKGLIIDDAINDAWAVLYTEVARTLPGPEPSNMVGPGQLDGESSTRSQGLMSLNNLVMNMDGSPSVSGSPGFAVLAAGPSGHPLGSIDASQRPRRVGIRRTEIIKRAEGAIARAGDPPRNIVSSTSQRRSSHPAVILESTTIPLLPVATTISTPPPRLAYSDLRAEAKDDSSAPGSVHDSADDESDLSDVPDMDDAEAETIFPNLMRRTTGTPAKDGDVMEE